MSWLGCVPLFFWSTWLCCDEAKQKLQNWDSDFDPAVDREVCLSSKSVSLGCQGLVGEVVKTESSTRLPIYILNSHSWIFVGRGMAWLFGLTNCDYSATHAVLFIQVRNGLESTGKLIYSSWYMEEIWNNVNSEDTVHFKQLQISKQKPP